MKKLLSTLFIIIFLQACGNKYELRKHYKDPNSPAAQLLGSTYAGVIETFNSLDECEEMKNQVILDDLRIWYTNSRFECVKR